MTIHGCECFADAKRRGCLTCLPLILCLGCATVATAQDFELYRPRAPESAAGQPDIPDEPPPATGDDKILVKELKALVLVDHPDKVVREAVEATGIEFRADYGLELLNTRQFYEIAQRYLGGPVSIRRLNELSREIVLLYRAYDLPVIDVSVPEQDISNGVVQLVVTEGRVGAIEINAGWSNPCRLVRRLCICSGQPVYESLLMEDLRYLNLNPFREVDLRLTPGESHGETDIVFDVTDRFPVSGYFGYEDTGNQSTQLERTIYGVYWGNAFDLDHSAGYQYTASPDFFDLEVHSASYAIPLRNRDELVFWGSYATLNSGIAVGFDSGGFAMELAFRYYFDLYPGPCRPRDCLQRKLLFGFDFRRTNTDLFFGQDVIFDSVADIAQIVVGYESTRQTCYGSRRLGITGFISPGGFSSFNKDFYFNQLQPGASAQYIYGRAYLEETVILANQWQLYGKLTGQASESALLASEQLGFGGYNSIRGYDMRQVNGDHGWLLNLELRTRPCEFVDCGCRRHVVQGLVFYDYGESRRHQTVAGLASAVDLASVGLGLRYSVHRNFSLRADYGWQLQRFAPTVPRNSRFHIGAVATF
jgi:hemolysin activation/secretion protein